MCSLLRLSLLAVATVGSLAMATEALQLPPGYTDEVDFLDNASPEEIAKVYNAPTTTEEQVAMYDKHPEILAKSNTKDPLEIHINRSTKHMTVSVDGKEKYSWPVTVGLNARGYGITHSYKGHPYGREFRHPDREFRGAVLPYVVKIQGGEFIHGTNAASYLGKAHSHGCVRLALRNAQTLYNLVGQYGLKGTWIVVD